ncbi:hypothetical protein OG21DRAFT_852377 [Imleria badia]|nr:hypothetical protein OG21DRAFT_852377 [Imleria badia]
MFNGLGKSPEGFSARSTVRASELRWVGWAPSRSQSEPSSEVQQTKHRLNVEPARGNGGWVQKQGAGEALDARKPARWQDGEPAASTATCRAVTAQTSNRAVAREFKSCVSHNRYPRGLDF